MKTRFWQLLSTLLLILAILPGSASAAGYTQTKYPIVLVHGLFGFDKLGNISMACPPPCAAAARKCM